MSVEYIDRHPSESDDWGNTIVFTAVEAHVVRHEAEWE